MPSFQRLVKFIIENEFLESEDRSVIKEVIYKLELDLTTFEEVGDKIKGQIKIEADIAYLLGRYRDKVNEMRIELEEEEAHVFLEVPKRNEDGYKTSSREFKAYQFSNPEIAIKRRRFVVLESLFDSLQLLCRIVFARNDKLKELSINYRREMKIDESQ